MFKKAFTLVEIILVIIISSILFVLLAKVYILASKLYVYNTNIKNVEKDLFFLNQTLQNLADSSEIDFDKYHNLQQTLGFTGNLYLKKDKTTYKIFLQNKQVLLEIFSGGSRSILPLTSTGTTQVKSLMFKILPYENPYKIFTPGARQPFVEVFIDIRNRFYSTGSWEQAVKYNLQEAFNFKYYNY